MLHIFNYELLNVELALLQGNSLIKCMDFFSDYEHVPNIKDYSQTQLLWTLHRNIILKLFFSNRKQNFETFGWCYYSCVTNIKMVPLSQMTNTGQFPLLRCWGQIPPTYSPVLNINAEGKLQAIAKPDWCLEEWDIAAWNTDEVRRVSWGSRLLSLVLGGGIIYPLVC